MSEFDKIISLEFSTQEQTEVTQQQIHDSLSDEAKDFFYEAVGYLAEFKKIVTPEQQEHALLLIKLFMRKEYNV